MTDSTINDNSTGTWSPYGVYNGADSTSTIHNSNVFGNSGYGVYNENHNVVISAENNWWGSDSGPAPFGSGNGINYRTCYDAILKVNYICQYYVAADPWLGKTVSLGSQLGHSGPAASYQAFVAEPVNTASGNYSYTHTDLGIATRGLPLDFARTYNGLSPQWSPLGWGWTHSWNLNVAVNGTDNSAVVTFGDGHTEKWNWTGSVYDGAPGVFGTLAKNGDNSFDLTQKDQTRYHFESNGRLTSTQDKNGNATTLTYDGQGRLTAVTQQTGRALALTYASPISTTLNSSVADST